MARHSMIVAITLAIAAVSTFIHGTDAMSLRRSEVTEAWRLLGAATETTAPVLPLQEKTFEWIQDGADSTSYHAQKIAKIAGDQAILVFHDRTINATAKAEAALVSYDVRSNANCVVSVCGTLTKWIIGSQEQCWGLKIAPKSTIAEENGVIRGISAAYTAARPAANKMYLKFDAVNYIDGSVCEYEVLSATKIVTPEAVVALEQA